MLRVTVAIHSAKNDIISRCIFQVKPVPLQNMAICLKEMGRAGNA